VHFYGKVKKMLQALKMDAPHLNDRTAVLFQALITTLNASQTSGGINL
jgi:hypothetical protein